MVENGNLVTVANTHCLDTFFLSTLQTAAMFPITKFRVPRLNLPLSIHSSPGSNLYTQHTVVTPRCDDTMTLYRYKSSVLTTLQKRLAKMWPSRSDKNNVRYIYEHSNGIDSCFQVFITTLHNLRTPSYQYTHFSIGYWIR
jgi:hypothetical protein